MRAEERPLSHRFGTMIAFEKARDSKGISWDAFAAEKSEEPARGKGLAAIGLVT
jgi:hypothetical protein